MDEHKGQQPNTGTPDPADPEERAFTGHPDHPPATPDQPVEGNQDLLKTNEEDAHPAP